ncbi:oligosaccharide flippase family protein [Hymenobacter koreensis]|uniref:Polysaccharide biosynthesis protein C-terminal domain-containing protein n=1 Tax=Hymenobacter koreensis TaxID=1084523 RepID=A0ABP8IUH5_9BACT
MSKPVARAKPAFWGAVSSQVFTIVSMLVSIISTPLMVKYLDKEEYGLSILFFQIIGYLALFDFGLSTALIRQLSVHRGEDELARITLNRIATTGLYVSAVLGGAVTLLGFGFAPFVPSLFNLRPDLAEAAIPIVATFSLLVGAQFLQRGLGGILFTHHKQVHVGVTQFILSMTGIVATIILLMNGVGLWSFVYANMLQLLLSMVSIVWLLRRYFPYLSIRPRHFDRSLMKELFGFGLFMFLGNLSTQIILNTDRLVIGKILSLSAVAVFSLTVRIPEVGMGLLAKVLENVGPAATEIVTHEGHNRTQLFLQRIMLIIMVSSIVAFWLMLALDEWFVDLWVGPSFFAGQAVLLLALGVMVQQTLARTGTFFLYAKGIARAVSIAAIVEAVLNITFSVILGYRMGMTGILLGTLLAALLTSVWYVPYLLRKHLGISFIAYWGLPIIRPTLILSVVGGMVWWAATKVQAQYSNSWSMFFLVAFTATLVLGGTAWIVFLRHAVVDYIPVRWRSYLLMKAV